MTVGWISITTRGNGAGRGAALTMTTFVAGSRSRAGRAGGDAACRVALGETGAGAETTGAETTGAETTGAETTGAETTGAETSVDDAGGDFRSRSVFFAFARP